ncbi:MAG TPA: capsular biosynthesis protein [Novosphingobium sp.]
MTEQRKIVPGDPSSAPPAASPAPRPMRSSVERAVEAFDLSRLGGIMPPADGRQRVVMRELSIEPMSEPAPTVPATPVIEVVPSAQAVSPASGAAGGAVVVPPMVGQPAVPPALAAAPVCFSATRHPIDRKRLRDQGLIVPEGTVTGLMEEFRIVKRQLLLQAAELARAGAGPTGQRVLICSPLPGEGKTYCATNLALAIAAEKESEVVLVDADFAKPSILSELGLPGGPGLMDALADPAIDVADCVIGTDIPGLWVLPAGNATNSDTEFLASSRTRGVLDRLTEGAPHRMVIFDSPPALAASPAAELAKYVGQALVVARADRTGQNSLEDAIALLSGCPNIQLLLNAVRFSPSGRRFGSYYGYRG